MDDLWTDWATRTVASSTRRLELRPTVDDRDDCLRSMWSDAFGNARDSIRARKGTLFHFSRSTMARPVSEQPASPRGWRGYFRYVCLLWIVLGSVNYGIMLDTFGQGAVTMRP